MWAKLLKDVVEILRKGPKTREAIGDSSGSSGFYSK